MTLSLATKGLLGRNSSISIATRGVESPYKTHYSALAETVSIAESTGQSMGFSFSFTVQADPACWTGLLSPFELRLLQPVPLYAVEQLRTRFLHAATTSGEPTKTARSVLQMAFDTEIGVTLSKLITIAPDVRASRVCERRRFLDIDTDMRMFKFLWSPALDALREQGSIPPRYLELLERHFEAGYPRYRIAAIAALLCMVASYLVEAA
jgi:hypothetical protein